MKGKQLKKTTLFSQHIYSYVVFEIVSLVSCVNLEY